MNTGMTMYQNWQKHREAKVATLQNQQLRTDRTVANNKPDIKIRDAEKGTCMLTDVAISGDRNVIGKELRRF